MPSPSGFSSSFTTITDSGGSTLSTQLRPRATIVARDAQPVAQPNAAPSQFPVPPVSQQASSPARFPFIVKLEERRLPNPTFQPYCQQMIAQADGSIVPKQDENGHDIIEWIKEAASNKADPQVTAGVSANGVSQSQLHQHRKGPNGESIDSAAAFVVRRAAQEGPSGLGEFALGADGSVKRLRKRNNEPSNSCHCQWVSPGQ